MTPTRLYGAVNFRYDPTSEAAIFTLVGADGSEPISTINPLVVNDKNHQQIQNGHTYVHNNAHTGIAAGASYWHVFTTGAREVHLTDYHTSSDSAPIWLAVSESPTFTGGSAAGLINRDRNSANTTTCTLVEGATVSAAGTHMESDYAAGTRQSGGSAALGQEWILKPNTSYAFLVRNDSTGAAIVSFHLEIMEDI